MMRTQKREICNLLLEYKDKGIKILNKKLVEDIAEKINTSPSKVWIFFQKLAFNWDISSIIDSLNKSRKRINTNLIDINDKESQGVKVQIEEAIKNEEIEDGENKRMVFKKPKKPSAERLQKVYERAYEGNNLSKIAKRYGRSISTIYRWLREYNIPRKIKSSKRLRNLGKPSKEELFKLYVEEKRSISDLAKKCFAGSTTIRRWLKQQGIKLRTLSEELLKNREFPEEEIKELYLNQNLSLKKIAEKYHTSKKVIKRILVKQGVEIRDYNDALSLAALKNKKLPTKEELYNLRFEQLKTIDEISKIYGVSHTPIMRLLNKYGMERVTLKMAAKRRALRERRATLEKITTEKYKGMRALVDLFSKATYDDFSQESVKAITLEYVEKLKTLYDQVGEENIAEELELIKINSDNNLESIILISLYRALFKSGLDIFDIDPENNLSKFEVLQELFYYEIRNKYIDYAQKIRNNINNKETNNKGTNKGEQNS